MGAKYAKRGDFSSHNIDARSKWFTAITDLPKRLCVTITPQRCLSSCLCRSACNGLGVYGISMFKGQTLSNLVITHYTPGARFLGVVGVADLEFIKIYSWQLFIYPLRHRKYLLIRAEPSQSPIGYKPKALACSLFVLSSRA